MPAILKNPLDDFRGALTPAEEARLANTSTITSANTVLQFTA